MTRSLTALLMLCITLSLSIAAPQPLRAEKPAKSSQRASKLGSGLDDMKWERGRIYGTEPNYWLPVIEILLQQLSFNTFSRIQGQDYAQITPSSMWFNLTNPWVFDEDGFLVNQIGHPYQGALYFTSARSSDLGFWTSAAYTFAGSLLWEYIWETERPSINDQITTAIGGVLVGEVLHRLALATLWYGGDQPSFWRKLGAFVLEPMGVLNRQALGFEHTIERPPNYFGYLSLGYGYFVTRDFEDDDRQFSNKLRLATAVTYGLPNDPTFTPDAPFEHFDIALDVDLSLDEITASIYAHGLLYGKRYDVDFMEGLWGVFVGQTFFSFGDIKLGSFDIGMGTTSQMDLGRNSFLQFTGRIGIAPLSGGGQRSTVGFRDYKFGPGLAQSIEVILGKRDLGMLKLTSRSVEIADGAFEGEIDIISANTLAAVVRVWRNHTLGLELDGFLARREFKDVNATTSRLNRSLQLRLTYSIQSDRSFGSTP